MVITVLFPVMLPCTSFSECSHNVFVSFLLVSSIHYMWGIKILTLYVWYDFRFLKLQGLMTFKRLNITVLILESVISTDLRFSCSFSKAGNLIHFNNLANAHIFLPMKFGTKRQKALDIFSSLRVILGYWNGRIVWGLELKLIPCFYSYSFWQSHIRDSETVIPMVCKRVHHGRYQKLDGPGSYSDLILKYYLEACSNLARMRHRLLAHRRKKEDTL